MAAKRQLASIFFKSVCVCLIFLQLTESKSYLNFIVVVPNGENTESCLNRKTLKDSSRDPCGTLDYVFDSISVDRRNDTQVFLNPGTHYLTKNASFEGIADFEITGDWSNNAEIICFPDVGFTFIRSKRIRIQNVTITGCGTLHHSTIGQAFAKIHINHTLFYTGIFIAYCKNITLQRCLIRDSTGIGLTMYDVGGHVTIHDSRFSRNKPAIKPSFAKDNNYALAGGGIYLELTYDGALPAFDVDDPERFEYQNGNRYLIENCTFKENEAPNPNFNLTYNEHPSGIYHMPFGDGGGVSIFFKGNARNNNVTMQGVNFHNNSAVAGGGFFVAFQDATANNSVKLSGSRFTKNTASISGGAVHSAIMIWERCNIAGNTITQENNFYGDNEAIIGGAVSQFFVPYEPTKGENPIREVAFKSCLFKDNRAHLGAALSLGSRCYYVLLRILRFNSRFPWKVVLENVTMSGNKIIFTEDRKDIGQGALYASSDVVLELRGNTFQGNSNTTLVLDNTILIVRDRNKFINNTGLQGGAMRMYGMSFINLMPGSTLEFIGNRAYEKGGAIHVAASGPPVLQFQETMMLADKYKCFLGYNSTNYLENVESWNTSIIFDSNKAKIGGGNSVYAYSLESCRTPGEGRTNNRAMQWSFITYRDSIYDCSEVATDPLDIVVYDDEWRVAPGEEFNPRVELYDEKCNLVQGIVQISIQNSCGNHGDILPLVPSPSLLIEPKNSSTSIVSGMKIYGNCKCPFTLTLTGLGSHPIQTQISNLHLNDCYMGFELEHGLGSFECNCMSHLSGVSRCSHDRKYVYLKNGYWGGMVSNSFVTSPCPPGYCSETVMKETPSGDYRMIPGTLCAKNRDQKSVLCGTCQQNCSVVLGSEDCECECNFDALYWFVPMFCICATLFVLIFLVLDFDIITVYLNAFCYTYQVIPNLISEDDTAFFQNDYFIPVLIGIVNWRISFQKSDICIKNMTGLTKLVMDYIFPGFILFVLLVLLYTRLGTIVSKVSGRSKFLQYVRGNRDLDVNGRDNYNATYRAICNLIMFSYTGLILTSFKIVKYVKLNDKWVLYADGSIEFYVDWRRHFVATVFAVILLFLAFVLVIILMVVPQFCHFIPGYHRVRLFFDCFQSCFEETSNQESIPQCTSGTASTPASQGFKGRSNRWFAGFYLLCRYVMFIAINYAQPGRFISGIACLLIASVCLYVKPYNSKLHWLNISDSILLLNLCLIGTLSNAVHWSVDQNQRFILRTTVHALSYIPLIHLAYLIYLCARTCRDYYYYHYGLNRRHQRLRSTSSALSTSGRHDQSGEMIGGVFASS